MVNAVESKLEAEMTETVNPLDLVAVLRERTATPGEMAGAEGDAMT